MLKRYDLKSDRKTHEGWAVIVIDTDIGFFATVSDFGNYSYIWSAPGGEFRKFLIGTQSDYLQSKLMMGRPDREVFDGEKTKAAILDYIEECSKEVLADTGEPWGLYEKEKDALEGSFNDVEDFYAWQRATALSDAWELAVYVPEPQCKAFCEKVWPRFEKLLREELEKEEQDKKSLSIQELG